MNKVGMPNRNGMIVEKSGTGIEKSGTGLGCRPKQLWFGFFGCLLTVLSTVGYAETVSVSSQADNVINVYATIDDTQAFGMGASDDGYVVVPLVSGNGGGSRAQSDCEPVSGNGGGCAEKIQTTTSPIWGVAEVIFDDQNADVIIYQFNEEGVLQEAGVYADVEIR